MISDQAHEIPTHRGRFDREYEGRVALTFPTAAMRDPTDPGRWRWPRHPATGRDTLTGGLDRADGSVAEYVAFSLQPVQAAVDMAWDDRST